MPLSLSTSWNAFRHTNAKKLIFEIKQAGFREVELSFNLTRQMVKDIAKLVRDNQVRVTSLHNFCPIPDGIIRNLALPDYYSMSSTDENSRRLAIKFTQRTISTAVDLNAQAVVLHTGRVEMPDHTKDLIRLYQAGSSNCAQFKRLKEGMIQERKKQAAVYFNNTLRSLEKINRYAEKLKVRLGVENRIYYREIPQFPELGIIFKKFQGSNIYYWHDTGHAQVMENLGISRHKDFLIAYAKYLLGMHLHNTRGCKDHQPPSKGDIDFKMFKPFIRPDTIKVIEAHYPTTLKSLVSSRRLVEKIFDAG